MEPVEVKLGSGRMFVSTFRRDNGERGILFKDSYRDHEIGEFGDEVSEVRRAPAADEVYISCGNIESARVLQDVVNKMLLEFVGCSVRQQHDPPEDEAV